MISVCMAAYNGERWIETQIRSVLAQLGPGDELVIVDDASTDRTPDKVRGIEDHRIRMVHNETNIGVDESFQRALSLARGTVLFLCDQDDIWYPDKVERVMHAFEANPEVTLVLSDARIIDGDDQVVSDSYFDARGAFIPGVAANIMKSKFLGCAMAVKSCMRDYFLPFPDRIPGHDMWIGVVNEYYGKSLFIPAPLIGYRRHGRNASPAHRQNLRKMLVWRWQLIDGLVRLILRNAVGRSKRSR